MTVIIDTLKQKCDWDKNSFEGVAISMKATKKKVDVRFTAFANYLKSDLLKSWNLELSAGITKIKVHIPAADEISLCGKICKTA